MITVRIEGLKELLSTLDAENVKTGLKRGLQKVGDSTKTRASSLIRDEFNIKKSDVDSKFRVTATAECAIITGSSKPISLTYFNARQMGLSHGKRVTTRRKGDSIVSSKRGKSGAFAGVAVMIRKGTTTLIPGAFIAKVKAGKSDFNVGVIIRKGKKRLTIINKSMVSVSTLFAGKKVMPQLIEHVNTVGLKTIEHEIEFAMTQQGKGTPGG